MGDHTDVRAGNPCNVSNPYYTTYRLSAQYQSILCVSVTAVFAHVFATSASSARKSARRMRGTCNITFSLVRKHIWFNFAFFAQFVLSTMTFASALCKNTLQECTRQGINTFAIKFTFDHFEGIPPVTVIASKGDRL